MLNLWWAAPLTDEYAQEVLRSLNPNADAVDIYATLERCKKDAAKFGVCLNEFFLRNGAQATNDARAACLKQLFSFARMMHGSGRILRIAAIVPAG